MLPVLPKTPRKSVLRWRRARTCEAVRGSGGIAAGRMKIVRRYLSALLCNPWWNDHSRHHTSRLRLQRAGLNGHRANRFESLHLIHLGGKGIPDRLRQLISRRMSCSMSSSRRCSAACSLNSLIDGSLSASQVDSTGSQQRSIDSL